ncbi:Vacuolar protein sorting protein vps66 [Coemansia erecta]|uniref:Vacuolar protein sorting protein vps66 n=1 Tax=Coemansia asiatica TaxID=1052880 RepID=A0A9W7XIM8_9FUNG|nr:Vacuolar protein sorting protein vps66 [Coemansia asiatica]KAJ2857766.1 Vacuolar protein sorting protein vps66 [Coemansia erecta]
MEKYSKWRDSGTGIHPFLQPAGTQTHETAVGSVLSWAKRLVVGPALAAVRMVVLGIAAAAEVAASAVSALLVVPSVRRGWERCTRCVLARLALLAMGFYWIDTKRTSLQRGRRSASKSTAKKDSIATVKSGDVILANHVSYVDVLYLVAKYNPVFVEMDNATMYVRPISLWTALRAPALPTPALLPAGTARPLKHITEEARIKQNGPVVVFPENATTNGRALLQLLPLFEEAGNQDEKSDLHLLALKYPFKVFSPAYSVGSQLGHLFRLCSQLHNSLVVRVLEPDEAPSIKSSALFCDAGDEPVDLDEAVRDKLVQLSRLRMTKLTAMDKRDFLAFYHKRSKGYKPTTI